VSSPLKVAVLGTGSLGKEHARIYAELTAAKKVEFVGVYDVVSDAAKKIAEKFQVRAFNSVEEISAASDALNIVTPTTTHFELAKILLQQSKHLLVEKPMTDDSAQAAELIQLARQNNCILQVGHIERFNPVFKYLETVATEPRFIETHRLSPYPARSTDIGVVLDLMIHDLEIILHLVRSPVQTIDAVGVPVLSRGEDIANARIRFENGCVANITSSRISPERMRKIRVFQEEAYVSLDYQNQTGEIYRRSATGIDREEVEIEREEPLKRQLAAFVDCAATGNAPKVSGFQATAALELAVEITKRIVAGFAA